MKSTRNYRGGPSPRPSPKGEGVSLRPTTPQDLAFVTALERHPDNRELIGQWSDAEHLDAIARRDGREHWIIEREGRLAGYLIAFDGREHGRGLYVKRILVGDKERGTGKAALAAFLEEAFARPGVAFVWLQVRDTNLRAQAVYDGLGFVRIDPPPEELAGWDAVDRGGAGVFRMRLDASARRSPAR